MALSAWAPSYAITPVCARALMTIEAARTIVGETRVPPHIAVERRREARIRSTHYSTRIEGNRLTLAQAADVIAGIPSAEPVRERDVLEVRQYWDALDRIEQWALRQMPLDETLMRRLHAIVERGPRAKATPYRTGQNVIRDSRSGAIVYLPPEADDVPTLMRALTRWFARAERDRVPVPILAGLVHYQFVTIHPYDDGNGRTARLLSNFILLRDGYGLDGLLALEEYHARDLAGYYGALVTHPHHNYYEGRATADLTGWVEYFVTLAARMFDDVRTATVQWAHTETRSGSGGVSVPTDRRARAVLALFIKQTTVTANDVAATLGVLPRHARNYLTVWVRDGWLVPTSTARKNRAYRLKD